MHRPSPVLPIIKEQVGFSRRLLSYNKLSILGDQWAQLTIKSP